MSPKRRLAAGPSLVPLGCCEAVVSAAEDIDGVYRGKRLTG
jgi:hypothetical protein